MEATKGGVLGTSWIELIIAKTKESGTPDEKSFLHFPYSQLLPSLAINKISSFQPSRRVVRPQQYSRRPCPAGSHGKRKVSTCEAMTLQRTT